MSLKQLGSRDIVGKFFERLEAATGMSWIAALSMLFPTTQQTENYKWLGFSPAMREWIGERQAKGLKVNGVSLTNVLYELTLAIGLDDIRRDKTGQIDVRIAETVDEGISHWATLMTTLLQNGESVACYDGQYFFDTDHSEGSSGTLSNDLSASDYSELNVATAANPTANELADVIMKMIQHMYTIKNDQGRPMNAFAKQFLVMVPVSFFGAAQQAVFSQNLETGTGVRNNPLAGLSARGWKLDVAANPELTWTTKLALFRTDGNAKPFIRQVEVHDSAKDMITQGEAMGIEMDVIAEGSEEEKKRRQWLFGISSNRSVGYGYWQHAVLATLS